VETATSEWARHTYTEARGDDGKDRQEGTAEVAWGSGLPGLPSAPLLPLGREFAGLGHDHRLSVRCALASLDMSTVPPESPAFVGTTFHPVIIRVVRNKKRPHPWRKLERRVEAISRCGGSVQRQGGPHRLFRSYNHALRRDKFSRWDPPRNANVRPVRIRRVE